MSDRAKTVAFYLPQYHAVPENDRWWGEGFTDWRNVQRAVPLFAGHDQPRSPASLGYYDLTDAAVVHQQARLAAENGIDAFCLYYYWFDGHRLLEGPLDAYLDAGPDFPFCLCWANENWTRRWDGKDREILIAQRYDEGTALAVFEDLARYLADPRYLRVGGAAVLLVHRADQLPDPAAYARAWRDEAVRRGVGPLYLVAVETTPGLDPRVLGFDALAEFPPVGSNTLSSALWRPVPGLSGEFRGRLLSYERTRRRFMQRPEPPGIVRHSGVMPGWDNTARRGTAATVYVGNTPARYAAWLEHARAREGSLRGRDGLVFVNAWNEWAEGAYLEPDATWGNAYLEATAGRVAPGTAAGPSLRARWPRQAHLRALAYVVASSVVAASRRLRSFWRRQAS